MSIDAMKACPSCGTPRGTRKTGWTPVLVDGVVRGYTCPNCPEHREPIKREQLKNGRVRWLATVVVVDNYQRSQRRKRFDSLDAARAWVAETRAGLVSVSWQDPSGFTVRYICERWIEYRRKEVGTKGGVREVTVNGYESALNAPLRLLGDRLAREVTTEDVQEALQTLANAGGKWKRPLSHRSLVYSLGALRQAYGYAKRRKWVAENPATDATAPGESAAPQPGRVKRWTLAELNAVKEALLSESVEPWLLVGGLLTLAGLRRSEVLGLDWSAVGMETGTVSIEASRVKTGRKSETAVGGPKTKNSKRVVKVEDIHPGFATKLKALWLAQGCPSVPDPVPDDPNHTKPKGTVVSDAQGPVHPDEYTRRFNLICAGAGVPRLTRIHNVRHSLAVALKEAGLPDNQAASMLGHDLATYLTFYVVSDDDAAAAAAKAAGQLFAVGT